MKQNLDIAITRKGRLEGEFSVSADPDDAGAMQKLLRDWLVSGRWHESRWGEFELTARDPATGRRAARVRT